VGDGNSNFIDDQLETATDPVDVIVDLNGCFDDSAEGGILSFLRSLGDVAYVGKYVSFVVVRGIDPGRLGDVAARPEVAMVEAALPEKWLGDNLRAALVEASGAYSPSTLADGFGWPATLNGTGVGIAFLDTGVGPAYDGSVTHGYNALTDTLGNPPPDPAVDHASWMASWVFGAGGISPQASLIDVKVGDASGADNAAVLRGLEKVYEQRVTWGVNVVTLMFSGTSLLDGREARQQLLDLLAGHGVVVVAGAGGNSVGTGVTGPGAATRALAVSAADVHGTAARGDDTADFVRGPRQDDGDSDDLDELKPELIVPTGESGTAVSNSIATATAAGLAALALQQVPDLRDHANVASGSLKDLLLRTAEVKGSADTTLVYPRSVASWDEYWGFGEVDAFQAFRRLTGQVSTNRTDVTFRGFDGTPHPSPIWYYARAIETQSERSGVNISSGVPDQIFARVINSGGAPADKVRVSFGFYPFTAGVPAFYDIGSKVVDLPVGADQVVSIAWTPPPMPAGEDHGCILVTLDYGLDSRFAGRSNAAQKNVRVAQTSSPATFTFRVENPLPEPAVIDLEVTTDAKAWGLKLSQTSFAMDTYTCPQVVTAVANPPSGAKKGEHATFFVTAFATPFGRDDRVEVGGVALRAEVAKTTRSWSRWLLVLVTLLAIGALLGVLRHWRS